MIGIVGGAGPLAGVDVVKKIIEETTARTDQDHVPVMLLSIPETTPDRTQYLIGEEPRNPAYPIAELFLRLERAGATVAAIPCNTAHADAIFGVVHHQLKSAGSKLQLVHMITETHRHIQRNFPGKRVGVLSTTGTRRTGLYKQAFESAGFVIVEPEEQWQDRVHNAIYDRAYGIKTFSAPVKPFARQELISSMDHLIGLGAEVIVLGCTEIPLAILEDQYREVPLIDPNRILARALIRAVDPGKLRA